MPCYEEARALRGYVPRDAVTPTDSAVPAEHRGAPAAGVEGRPSQPAAPPAAGDHMPHPA